MGGMVDGWKKNAGAMWDVVRGVPTQEETALSDSEKQMRTLLGRAPIAMPDLSDPSVQAAKQAALLNAQLGQTRRSTFLTDGEGLAPPTMGQNTLLGG